MRQRPAPETHQPNAFSRFLTDEAEGIPASDGGDTFATPGQQTGARRR
jgi:hypothetical protein